MPLMSLPFFPEDITLINISIGFENRNVIVYCSFGLIQFISIRRMILSVFG